MSTVLTTSADEAPQHQDAGYPARWEHAQLDRLGFDDVRIELLIRGQVSWHQADDLLRAGCGHALAMLILL